MNKFENRLNARQKVLQIYPGARKYYCYCLLAIISILILSGCKSSTEPSTGSHYRLAYWAQQPGNMGRLYTIKSNGEDNRPISDFYSVTSIESAPDWSPDGQRIVFDNRETRDIMSVNWDGSDLQNLTNDQLFDFSPKWSPDGTQIVYSSQNPSPFQIFVMDADGSNPRQITQFPSSSSILPKWSPDGRKIAFLKKDGRVGPFYQAHIIDVDGGNLKLLYNKTVLPVAPAWSPDGTRLALVSFENDVNNREIYVVQHSDTSFLRLTNNSDWDNNPRWTPDGGRIIFDSRRNDEWSIYWMNPDGSDIQRLTGVNQINFTGAAITPDGNLIACISNEFGPYNNGSRIFSLNLIRGRVEKLTERPDDDTTLERFPIWSPVQFD